MTNSEQKETAGSPDRTIVCLHDREHIAAFLRREAPLHLYALGDLDPFFWPHTLWYGLEIAGELRQIALGYITDELLILHALGGGPPDELRALLHGIRHLLPQKLYAHLSPGLSGALAEHYELHHHGDYVKMLLTRPERLAEVETSQVTALSRTQLDELLALYTTSYPGNWFDPRMLDTGQYYGLRVDGALVSVAGVHVYAPDQGVAALGNIVTRSDARGRGYAAQVTARLCLALLETVDRIGLNVAATNAAAIACYQRLGFEAVATYEEIGLSLRTPPT